MISAGTVQFLQNWEIFAFFKISDARTSNITVQDSRSIIHVITHTHQCKIIANWNLEHNVINVNIYPWVSQKKVVGVIQKSLNIALKENRILINI